MENKKTLGEYICQRRKALGLTQQEFASRLYVTNSAVSKWERGLSYPDITLIHDICEILQISEHELLTASEDVEARSAERLAKKYLRLARTYRLVQYVLYGGATSVCLAVDLFNGGRFGWSLIVLASLLLAASFTLVPALAPERMGGVWVCGFFTLSLLLLLGACAAYTGGSWFPTAACAVLLGLSALLLPFVLRRVPLPAALSRRKALLYIAAETALLFLLLAVIRLTTSPGTWLISSILGILLAEAVLLLPLVRRQLPLPEELRNHKAAVWLAAVSVLLLALLGWSSYISGTGSFFSNDLAIALICLALPIALLVCLRYLPLRRSLRASAACAASALWVWLAPWGVDRVLLAGDWLTNNHYDPLHPYNVDFSDWVSAPTAGGNVMVLILAALSAAAVVLAVIGLASRRK